jgi:NAD(P)H-quinone oxidoreductase subunit N
MYLYRRRIRATGYTSLCITAKGLGDLAMYLTGVHGIRPPHLGKKDTGQGAAVGYRYYVPPIVSYQVEQLPPHSRGLLLWVIEGHVLSTQELAYLTNLPKIEPKVRVAIEVGGDRYFRWQPLQELLDVA